MFDARRVRAQTLGVAGIADDRKLAAFSDALHRIIDHDRRVM
jgi:hypothetical protein